MTSHDSAVVARLDLDAVRIRYSALVASAADVPQLVSEVERLRVLVLKARIAYANLRAAARAALSAAGDGEPDPFAYLVDELHGEWPTLHTEQGRP